MCKKEKILSMLREIVNMPVEEYMFFSVMMRAHGPDELQEQVSYILQSTIDIRKVVIYGSANNSGEA